MDRNANKVLFVVNGDFYSGAERVQDLLAQNLPALGFDVGLACLKSGKLQQFFQAKDVPIHTFEMRSRFDMAPVERIVDLVRRDGYTLLHTHTPRAALIGRMVSSKAKIPMVHHVHSPASRDTESFFRNRFNAFVENWSLKKASQLVAVSESLKQHMTAEGFRDSQITVVPNGVKVLPDQAFSPSGSDGGFVVGVVALFRPRKGLEVLIKAIARLKREGVPVRLLAVGGFETAEYNDEILRLAIREDVSDLIDWVGFTTDVNGFFRKMNLFVLPSLYGEGLPMVIIEAMANGVPVVASSVEGIPDVLADDAGVVVAPGDVDELTAAIGKCRSDTGFLERMAANGRERQRRLFSDASMANGIAGIYADVLKGAA